MTSVLIFCFWQASVKAELTKLGAQLELIEEQVIESSRENKTASV